GGGGGGRGRGGGGVRGGGGGGGGGGRGVVVRLGVPAGAEDHLEARPLRHVADGQGVLDGQEVVVVAAQAAGRLVDQGDPAGLSVAHQLAVRQLGVVQEAHLPGDLPGQVRGD